MFAKFFRPAPRKTFEGQAWGELPPTYADGPRELRNRREPLPLLPSEMHKFF